MIELRNIEVTPFLPSGYTGPNVFLRVTWEVAPTSDDLDLYEITVWRSTSPDDDFIQVSAPFFNSYDYIDYDVNLYSKTREYYYKVRTRNVDTGKTVEIGPARLEDIPDILVLEIIRRNNLLLKNMGVGIPCAIMIRKTFGQKCGFCYDAIKHRATRSDCADCYGTTYAGGYFEQINALVNFNPNPKLVNITVLGEIQPGETGAWMSNYPELNPGDLIVEPTNKRWRVAAMDSTRKQRHLCHQILRLAAVNRGDAPYSVPVTDPRVLLTELDKAFRFEHTVISRTTEFDKVQSRSVPV